MPSTKVGEKHLSAISHCVPRIDGADKAMGRARYAAGIYMERMLYASILRSPYSGVRVMSVDAARAKGIPGVEVVATCSDIPRTKSWTGHMYLTDMIRYPGDCVAMIAIRSKELADEALEAIHIGHEELPDVYTVGGASSEGIFTVYEKYPDDILRESMLHIRKRDPDTIPEKADIILEKGYGTQYIEHSYAEPKVCVCYLNPNDGVMTAHSAPQNPFFTKRYVAGVLGVPMNQIRMMQEILGGTFGGKEEGAGLMAGRRVYPCNLVKKSAKFISSGEDSFLESAKRHLFRLRHKAGFTEDGWIVVWWGEQVDDRGACNNQIQPMNRRANVHSAGPCEIDDIETDTYGAFINNIHPGVMRDYLPSQLIRAQEQLIKGLAMACDMGKLEFRRKNPPRDGVLVAAGVPVEYCVIQEIVDVTAEQTGCKEKHAVYLKQPEGSRKRRDIGLAVCYRGSELGTESPDASGCMMTCNGDGPVMISSGLAENGQGLETAYVQIAAEALGVSHEAVRFFDTDTHSIPDCGMIVASKGTVIGAQSIRKTGEKLRGVMTQDAPKLHSLPLEEIEKTYGLKKGTLGYDKLTAGQAEFLNSQFYLKKYPDVKVPFSDVRNVCLWTGRQVAAFGWFKPQDLVQDHETRQERTFPISAYGCTVAEVEVDIEISYADVLEVTVSHDTRIAINPVFVKGQICGDIVMGQGFAMAEGVATDKRGQKTKNSDSYTLSTSMDAPKMNINIYENQGPAGAHEAKSIEEPVTEGVGAAIANATSDATG